MKREWLQTNNKSSAEQNTTPGIFTRCYTKTIHNTRTFALCLCWIECLWMYELRRVLDIIYTHSNLSAGGNVSSGVDGAASALIFVVKSFRSNGILAWKHAHIRVCVFWCITAICTANARLQKNRCVGVNHNQWNRCNRTCGCVVVMVVDPDASIYHVTKCWMFRFRYGTHITIVCLSTFVHCYLMTKWWYCAPFSSTNLMV